MPDSAEITFILEKIQNGDQAAAIELVPLVYPELRKIGRRLMSGERIDHTLQPTALVNEAYLRLAGTGHSWRNRAHFFGVAAHLMRNILVDCARRRGATKRPLTSHRADSLASIARNEVDPELILEVDRAMTLLAQWDSRQCRIVELRFFGGLTEEEIAEVLGISTRTVKRDWGMAKAWLHGQLSTSSQIHDA
ncbi:MAG: sigma-70 family RNA polymerase sigma factor [Bryobacteraceae bacterium]